MVGRSTREAFDGWMRKISASIAGMAVGEGIQELLNKEFGADSPAFAEIQDLCRQAVAEGWMCREGEGDLCWGRVCEASEALHGFSVDVVSMAHRFGPHHSHPLGEILLVLPQTPAARFDAKGAGWLVYPPGSAHYPTVSGGLAYVLYLLPQGKIAFTK